MYPTHGSLVQRPSVIEHGNRTAEPQRFLQSQIHSQHHAFSLKYVHLVYCNVIVGDAPPGLLISRHLAICK